MLRSKSTSYACESEFTLRKIADGTFDDDLRKWGESAAEVTAIGFPLICEWGTEANGAWFPWNALYDGGEAGPGLFKDAYRRIVQTVRHGGGSDISWVYHVNHQSDPAADWNTIERYDPGPDCTDWVGVSLYGGLDPAEQPSEWTVFSQRYGEIRGDLVKLAGRRPIMISEFGCTVASVPDGHGNYQFDGTATAQWATDALNCILHRKYPEIRGFSWWNEGWTNAGPVPATEMRVQKVPELRQAFQSAFVNEVAWLAETPCVTEAQ